MDNGDKPTLFFETSWKRLLLALSALFALALYSFAVATMEFPMNTRMTLRDAINTSSPSLLLQGWNWLPLLVGIVGIRLMIASSLRLRVRTEGCMCLLPTFVSILVGNVDNIEELFLSLLIPLWIPLWMPLGLFMWFQGDADFYAEGGPLLVWMGLWLVIWIPMFLHDLIEESRLENENAESDSATNAHANLD